MDSFSDYNYISSCSDPEDLETNDSLKEFQVILYDTPGFGDTAGAEIDLSNDVGIEIISM